MRDVKKIRTIVIVGGGTAGWITAAALSRLYRPDQLTIHLIESEEIGTVGVGEATVPHIRFFNQRLGIDERQFMRETAATFKLGIEFVGWGSRDARYVHPFGAYGHDLTGVGFHHHWLRARQAGDSRPICDYSVPVKMSHAGKFTLPSEDASSPAATFSYAYQFDASLYAAFLRRLSQSRGVVRTEGKVVSVDQSPDTGNVTSVVMGSGERIEGDLFIDCSGFRGLLIEQTLQTGYDDWSPYLPCDRAWAVPCHFARSGAAQARAEGRDGRSPLPDDKSSGRYAPEISPYTRATARDAGWQWRIPLQHRVGNGYVFSSRFIDEAAARDTLLNNLESAPQAEPKLLRFLTGVRKQSWNRNVVAIGLSSGFLEPLESTSIHLIQLAVTHLVELMPDADFRDADRDEFNRTMAREYEAVRDFLILHYHATTRDDTPFWNYVRTMAIPASLQTKIDLFKSRGVVVGYKEGFFLEPSWLAVYLGQGIVPEAYDPLSHRLDDTQLAQALAQVRREVGTTVSAMPAHADFLDRFSPFTPAVAGAS